MDVYDVTATRDDGWWIVLADVGTRTIGTQTRRLDQIDGLIREAIALALDVAEDAFGITVTVEIERLPGIEPETIELIELRSRLDELVARSRELTPRAVKDLRESGLTVRDVARLLDLTPSRISQIQRAG